MKLSDQDIEAIARKIASELTPRSGAERPSAPSPLLPCPPRPPIRTGRLLDNREAVVAARKAFPKFVALPMETRGRIIAAIRSTMLENASALAKAAHEETRLGRLKTRS